MPKKRNSPDRDSLSVTQRDAIRLLASGCTAKYAALVLKLDYAMVRKWLKQDPQFQSELEAQREAQRAQPPDVASPSGQKRVRADKKKRANPAA